MIKKLLIAFCALFVLSGCAKGKKGLSSDEEGGNDYADSTTSEFLADGISNRVYFNFDSSELDNDSKETLKQQAEWMKSHESVSFVIEGHCDSRGTVEYNLALGERRADMAKRFLVSLGVDASRLEVVSYGKERPAALGEGEEVHKLNRRSVTVIRK
jgi:peptidoglycan-associated lipoprotein